jgi:Holliday junction resolvasome RuvABC endonuclease subunit
VNGALHVGGLDQSLTSFGFAAIHADDMMVWRMRYPARKPAQPAQPYQHDRLEYLIGGVRNAACGAHVMALEDMAFGAKGDALTDLGGLFWITRHTLWLMRVPYVVINSSHRRKWITGRGNADKDEVLAETIKRFPMLDIRGNDEADALVLAAMTADYYGEPVVKMPADRTAILHAVHTPRTTKDTRKHGQLMISWPQIERGTAA